MGTKYLNNGVNYIIPSQSLVTRIIVGDVWSYDANSSAAVFYLLDSFRIQCDAKGSIGSATGVYNMVQDLSYQHDYDWYHTGQGKTYMDTIQRYGTWIYGGLDEGGGVCLVKLNSDRYAFISYSGIFKEDEGDLYSYGFQASCYYYDGTEHGSLSAMETHEGFISYLNLSPDNIYFVYQPDGYEYHYTDSYNPLVPATNYYGDIEAAMASSEYFIESLDVFPWYIWKVVDKQYHNVDNSKGYVKIDSQYSRPGFSLVEGGMGGNSDLNLYDDPYANAGEPGDSDTGGNYDGNTGHTDVTDPDEQFDIDGINSGFYTLYNPTKAQIKAFNDFLFQDIDDTLSQQLKRLVANPLDYVLFIAMCHFHPNIKNSDQEIQFCGIDSGVTSHVINKQNQQIDCDWIYINEKDICGGFMSYNPYTQIQLFLPYIGIVDLNTDDVMGAYLHLVYTVDLMTGSCLAQLKAKRDKRTATGDAELDDIIGEYSGNVYQNMPISATDWRGLFQSVIQFAGGLIQAGSGNVIGGVASAANAVMSDKVSVSKSGKLGANYGYMGGQIPYVIISRPIPAMPNGFSHREGLPTYKVGVVSDFKGYLEIDPDTVWTDKFDGITSEEASMLKSICNSGIRVNVNK